jgi:hypothetical protein
MTTTSAAERRTSRRFSMSLPLVVRFPEDGHTEETTAETKDVSFRGLYFMLESHHQIGAPIEFVLTLPKEITLAGDVQIRCAGEVVRVEDHSGRNGFAARIDKYEFLPRTP